MNRLYLQLAIVCLWPSFPIAQKMEQPSLEEIFRRGLFAEEVDSDLETAKAAYTEVLQQFDGQKKVAATAAFRLAEVYRKLAVANPAEKYQDRAVREYERILREFPDVEELVKLSRENLVALGKAPTDPVVPALGDEESAIIAQLKRWKETSPDKLEELPTPLYQAAKANQLRVAEYLISQKVALEKDVVTPLTAAAGEGHLSMVELLLDAGADPRPEGKFPPIHMALGNYRMAVVEKLIEVGAHLKFENHQAGPPLHFISDLQKKDGLKALDKESIVEFAELLIKAGSAVDEVNQRTGKTPLFVAVENRFEGMVILLLERGADVNRIQSKPETTPLIQTVKSSGALSAIKLLLAAGAKVDLADDSGFTALHHCLLKNRTLVYVETLLEAGADVTRPVGENGWTPLHFWALRPSDDRIARLLYGAGGNPIALADHFPDIDENIPDVSKNTPLGILYEKSSETNAIVRNFYEHGIQSLPPEKFVGKVWFAMPAEPDEVADEIAAMSPTDLIANIFPVFREDEIAWTNQDPDTSTISLQPPGLAELITEVYGNKSIRGIRNQQKTPNLQKLRILRPVTSPNEELRWKIVTVFYKDIAAAAEGDSDFPLQWGDVVLFDQLDKHRSSIWYQFRFENEKIDLSALRKAATLEFKLTLGDISSDITFAPPSGGNLVEIAGSTQVPHSYQSFSSPSSLHNLGEFTRYREDLDLSLAIVVRTVEDRTEKISIPLDTFEENSDFFLKDGDHVIIPRKQGVDRLIPKNRMDAIWISNPGNHLLTSSAHRSSFTDRPVPGLSLARSVAQYYSTGRVMIPFPDFSKIRLWKPGSETPDIVQLFPPKEDSAEMLIPWGTIIEIPIEEGKTSSDWTGLSREQQDFLRDSSKLSITVHPEGQEPKPMIAEFSFPRYERSPSGLLIEEYHRVTGRPNFWDLLGEEFRGEDVKWDSGRFILEADGKTWNYTSGHTVSDFLDGDVLKIFRKL